LNLDSIDETRQEMLIRNVKKMTAHRYIYFYFVYLQIGDGSIDIEEFTSVCSTYGVGTSESQQAFNKLSRVSLIFKLLS
jgi:hypothetical protein